MSTIHRAAIPANITAIMTKALREVADGVLTPAAMAFLSARDAYWSRSAP